MTAQYLLEVLLPMLQSLGFEGSGVSFVAVPEGIYALNRNGEHLLIRVDPAKLEVAGSDA